LKCPSAWVWPLKVSHPAFAIKFNFYSNENLWCKLTKSDPQNLSETNSSYSQCMWGNRYAGNLRVFCQVHWKWQIHRYEIGTPFPDTQFSLLHSKSIFTMLFPHINFFHIIEIIYLELLSVLAILGFFFSFCNPGYWTSFLCLLGKFSALELYPHPRNYFLLTTGLSIITSTLWPPPSNDQIQ
jgi:hypothetical protein